MNDNRRNPSCAGKSVFLTFTAAAQRAKRMRQRLNAPLEAYHCSNCRKFHVGTPALNRNPRRACAES